MVNDSEIASLVDDNDNMTMMMMMMMSFRDFFGISSDFQLSQLLYRGGEKTSLFYVSPTLKNLIDFNQSTVNVCVTVLPTLMA